MEFGYVSQASVNEDFLFRAQWANFVDSDTPWSLELFYSCLSSRTYTTIIQRSTAKQIQSSSAYSTTLQRDENCNGQMFFALIHQKSGPTSSFFLLNFKGYRPFFEQFSEKKKSNFFRQKYPTTVPTNFVKVDSNKIHLIHFF